MPPKKQVGKQSKSTPSKLSSSSKQTGTKKPSTISKGKVETVGKLKASTGAKKQVKSQADHDRANGTKSEVPKKGGWTRNDEMARKIQTVYRGYCCRKMLLNLRKKKAEYDELMEKLQREAYQKVCKFEREREEEQRKRQEEERKKQRESAIRMQRMLEAAFDGDVMGVKEILSEVSSLYSGEQMIYIQQLKLVECTDPNGNTPISEAAAGGNPDTIRFLLDLGADPNRKGQYGRTPLYRAAFCGHLEAVKVLLELGADPRIHADDGAVPQQVAANAPLIEFFQQWDVKDTESMLIKLEAKFSERLQIEKKFQDAEESKIQAQLDKAEMEYSSKQKQLSKAHEELNKRIFEHDKYGHVKEEITLQAVHDAEDVLEIAKLQAEEARKKLQKIRLEQRVMRKKFLSDDIAMEDEHVDIVINIRELDDVLMKDVGNKIADSGKWPLLVDPGEQAVTFLRYRDTNYLNSCNPRHMEPETIRLAILGAIRYGKCAVLDLLDIEDMWPVVQHKFDAVQKDLFSDLMSKVLLKKEKYLTLIKESDGEEYTPKMFIGARIHNFKFVVVTQLSVPPQELLHMCYSIKIHALK